jgi:diguanylate cyclase (GGDEF)-like protein
VDFSLGAVAFVDGEDLDVMFVIHHPVSPAAIEAVGVRLADEARRHLCGTLGEVRARLLTLSSAGDERFEEDALEDLLAYPIVSNGCLVGMIALAGQALRRLTALDKSLLEKIANQAHIVVENSRLIERLRNLSIRDGLTELYNHRHIMETVGAEFERACRYGSPMSLMMLDIDHFKRVNDQHGHQTGDVVLRDVARLLTGALRSVDAVGRYGGEEFLVVLPHTGYDETRRTAERLRRLVGDHAFRSSDKDLCVTISVGVASYPHGDDVRSASDLLRVADQALYRAKEGGRNRVVGAAE